MQIITRQEAKEKGLKRYFTGNACKYGHCVERYASNGKCIVCKNNNDKRHHKKNLNEYKQKSKEYYLKIKISKQLEKIGVSEEDIVSECDKLEFVNTVISIKDKIKKIFKKNKELKRKERLLINQIKIENARMRTKKKCYKCNDEKSITEFFKDKFICDGYSAMCKQCCVIDGRRKRAKGIGTGRSEYMKKWREENKDYINTVNNSPKGKIRQFIRGSLKRIVERIKQDKEISYTSFTAYSHVGLKEHLERQFKADMTWDNHGTVWHIDHKVPLSYLVDKYNDTMDQQELMLVVNALDNLQPLYVYDNLSKGCRLDWSA